MTLQQAILAAGGVKDVADWADVRLYRRAPSGQVEVTTVDLDAVEGGKPAPDLQRKDVVIVGKHLGKAFFYGFVDFFKCVVSVAPTSGGSNIIPGFTSSRTGAVS